MKKMRNLTTLIIGGIIVLILLLYMVTFTVPFDHAAVVETFSRADAGSVRNADGDGAGLRAKWPWPVQNVSLYDRRLQVLEDVLQEQKLADGTTVLPQVHLVWRISDPLAFHRTLRTTVNAEERLQARLRSAATLLSSATLAELTRPEDGRLAEIEDAIAARLRRELSAPETAEDGAAREGSVDYGVSVESVGITRLKLPRAVTRQVLEGMKATRESMAEELRSEGEAIANAIESRAREDAKTIRSFAEYRAQAIRGEGDQAAAEYYERFSANPEFAILLDKLETLRKTLQNNTTVILDSDMTPYDLFARSPLNGSGEQQKDGEAPREDQQ